MEKVQFCQIHKIILKDFHHKDKGMDILKKKYNLATMSKFKIHVSKEHHKFSAAHFTIFEDTIPEKLHGHNYYVSLDIECRESQNGLTIEFRVLKKILNTLCNELDEKILLPGDSPYLKISKQHEDFEVVFSKDEFTKRYLFPVNEVEIIPVENITVEMLAKYLCEIYIKRIQGELFTEKAIKQQFISLSIEVQESRGQSVSYIYEF